MMNVGLRTQYFSNFSRQLLNNTQKENPLAEHGLFGKIAAHTRDKLSVQLNRNEAGSLFHLIENGETEKLKINSFGSIFQQLNEIDEGCDKKQCTYHDLEKVKTFLEKQSNVRIKEIKLALSEYTQFIFSQGDKTPIQITEKTTLLFKSFLSIVPQDKKNTAQLFLNEIIENSSKIINEIISNTKEKQKNIHSYLIACEGFVNLLFSEIKRGEQDVNVCHELEFMNVKEIFKELTLSGLSHVGLLLTYQKRNFLEKFLILVKRSLTPVYYLMNMISTATLKHLTLSPLSVAVGASAAVICVPLIIGLSSFVASLILFCSLQSVTNKAFENAQKNIEKKAKKNVQNIKTSLGFESSYQTNINNAAPFENSYYNAAHEKSAVGRFNLNYIRGENKNIAKNKIQNLQNASFPIKSRLDEFKKTIIDPVETYLNTLEEDKRPEWYNIFTKLNTPNESKNKSLISVYFAHIVGDNKPNQDLRDELYYYAHKLINHSDQNINIKIVVKKMRNITEKIALSVNLSQLDVDDNMQKKFIQYLQAQMFFFASIIAGNRRQFGNKSAHYSYKCFFAYDILAYLGDTRSYGYSISAHSINKFSDALGAVMDECILLSALYLGIIVRIAMRSYSFLRDSKGIHKYNLYTKKYICAHLEKNKIRIDATIKYVTSGEITFKESLEGAQKIAKDNGQFLVFQIQPNDLNEKPTLVSKFVARLKDKPKGYLLYPPTQIDLDILSKTVQTNFIKKGHY